MRNDGGTGTFALVDSSANLLGTHALPSGVDGNIGVAANGTSLAVAYERNDTELVELAIFNLSGGLGGTTDLSLANYASVVLLAVAAVPNGYVVLWAHDRSTLATYVPALNGKPGTPQEFLADPSYTEPLSAKAASDGVGAAFLIQYPSGVSFGYLNGNLENPFELTGVAPGGAVVDIAGGQGGRLGLFYTQNGQLYGRQAGYASLSGADCAVASDCASGVCKAVVATGPAARSACQ